MREISTFNKLIMTAISDYENVRAAEVVESN